MSKVYVEMTEEEYLSWLEFKNGKKVANESKDDKEMEELLDTQVLSVFDTRTSNALRRGYKYYDKERISIYTIRDLVSHTERELKQLRNLGKKGIKEIKDWLTAHNLNLAY